MALVSTPLNEHNAIESASFAVVFARGLARPTFEKIREALNIFEKELPGAGAGEATLQMQGLPQIPGFGIKTLEASRFVAKLNGTPSWLVQAMGNMVQVQCHDYTSFQEVWPKARRYLLCALNAIDENIRVGEVGLQIIDRFKHTAEGVDAYDIKELFNPATRYLTPHALNAGAFWHVYQGWFDSYEDKRILHQLNLSNTLGNAKQELHTIIDHRAALRAAADGGTLELKAFVDDPQASTTSALDTLYDTLHKQNMAVIKNLLNPEKQEAIGIEGGH